MKRLFQFAILPLKHLLLLPLLLRVQRKYFQKPSDNKKNNNEMSISDKLKIGSSGLIELVSKPFEYIWQTCFVVSGLWGFFLFESMRSCGHVLVRYSPESAAIVFGTPVAVGGVSFGIDYGLTYLSEKVMPSEKQPKKIIVIENFKKK